MSLVILRPIRQLSNYPKYSFIKVRNISLTNVCRGKLINRDVTRKEKGKFKSPITWKSLGITTVISGVILSYMYYLKRQKDMYLIRERRKQLGKAAIGGKFELSDFNGKVVKSDDFLGQWVLIYFGFTHCPDVCPDELEKLSLVVDKLESEYNLKVQPLFISVDPERDTPALVDKYVKEFSPKIIGLSGSPQQTDQVCKSYRVYYSNGPKDQDNDYIVDHTIIIYLIDPEGLFVDYFGQSHKAEQIVNSIMIQKSKYDRYIKG